MRDSKHRENIRLRYWDQALHFDIRVEGDAPYLSPHCRVVLSIRFLPYDQVSEAGISHSPFRTSDTRFFLMISLNERPLCCSSLRLAH